MGQSSGGSAVGRPRGDRRALPVAGNRTRTPAGRTRTLRVFTGRSSNRVAQDLQVAYAGATQPGAINNDFCAPELPATGPKRKQRRKKGSRPYLAGNLVITSEHLQQASTSLEVVRVYDFPTLD